MNQLSTTKLPGLPQQREQCLLGLGTLRGIHRDRPLERCLLRRQQPLERGASAAFATCNGLIKNAPNISRSFRVWSKWSKSNTDLQYAWNKHWNTAGQGLTHCAGAWNAESRPARLAGAEPSWKPPISVETVWNSMQQLQWSVAMISLDQSHATAQWPRGWSQNLRVHHKFKAFETFETFNSPPLGAALKSRCRWHWGGPRYSAVEGASDPPAAGTDMSDMCDMWGQDGQD